jgi:hypothetical protein
MPERSTSDEAGDEAPRRVVIEAVSPEIDAGPCPIQRIAGDPVEVTASICTDGHDRVAAVLPLKELGIDLTQPFQMHDLLGGARRLWQGPRNHVALDPASAPAHVLRVRRRLRSERDFDCFL